MKLTGGCYCGALRYETEGEPLLKVQCHCRECQYISGGGPNMTMGMPKSGFRYTRGEPKSFTRSDLETPVTREFCGNCGTQILSKAPIMPDGVFLKVGTLDDPSVFSPDMAIFTVDRQPFHLIPEGMPSFEALPG